MRIGLLGYYGFGNFGDELFKHVFETHALGGHEIVMLEEVTGHRKSFHASAADRAKFAASVDALLIGGGDLIRPDNPMINYWFDEYMTKPVVLSGVGVTHNHSAEGVPATVAALKKFLTGANVRAIHLRDEESCDWITEALQPTCETFYSPDIVCALETKRIPDPDGRKILGIATRKTAKPDPVHTKKIQAFLDHYKAQGWTTRALMLGTGSTFDDDMGDFEARKLRVDEVVIKDTNVGLIEEIAKLDLFGSMKFHGCIVGMMAGVPTVSWARTAKFVNFYRYINRPELIAPLGGDQTSKLIQTEIKPLRESELTAIRAAARAGLTRAAEALLRV